MSGICHTLKVIIAKKNHEHFGKLSKYFEVVRQDLFVKAVYKIDNMNINNVVILLHFLFTKLKFPIYKTEDFLIPGIDYLSRIWHHFLEFWILNALQLCTCLALYIF